MHHPVSNLDTSVCVCVGVCVREQNNGFFSSLSLQTASCNILTGSVTSFYLKYLGPDKSRRTGKHSVPTSSCQITFILPNLLNNKELFFHI